MEYSYLTRFNMNLINYTTSGEERLKKPMREHHTNPECKIFYNLTDWFSPPSTNYRNEDRRGNYSRLRKT